MEGLRVMSFETGYEHGIKCRFISLWFKVDIFVLCKERLLFEIERNRPDVVLIDPNCYVQIDGIKTARTIRHQLNIPVMYK